MGEAKRRGTFTQRKDLALQKIAVTNGHDPDQPPNEWIIRNFIISKKPKALNPHWVYWMLALLYEAHKSGQPIDLMIKDHPLSKREPLMEITSQETG